MAKRKESKTEAVQAAQSQPADAETAVKADPDADQSRQAENEVQENTESKTEAVQAAQSQPADAETAVKADPDADQSRQAENEVQENTESKTEAVQAAQSQPADTETAVKADSDQSGQPENEAEGNPEPQQNHPPENDWQRLWEMMQNPEQEEAGQDGSGIMQAQEAAAEKPPAYVIICRNKINKMIGGVSFVNGVGHTSDGFAASWFGNKEGYEVRNSEL